MLNIVKSILFICLLWPLQAVSNDAACIAVTLTKEVATEEVYWVKEPYMTPLFQE